MPRSTTSSAPPRWFPASTSFTPGTASRRSCARVSSRASASRQSAPVRVCRWRSALVGSCARHQRASRASPPPDDSDAGADTLPGLACGVLSISAEEETALRGPDRCTGWCASRRRVDGGSGRGSVVGPWLPSDCRRLRARPARAPPCRQDCHPASWPRRRSRTSSLRARRASRCSLAADPAVAGDIATCALAGTVSRIGTGLTSFRSATTFWSIAGPGRTRHAPATPWAGCGRDAAIGKTTMRCSRLRERLLRPAPRRASAKGELALVHGSPLGLAAIQVARWLEAALYGWAADAEERLTCARSTPSTCSTARP
jgi:hypothetical protein